MDKFFDYLMVLVMAVSLVLTVTVSSTYAIFALFALVFYDHPKELYGNNHKKCEK